MYQGVRINFIEFIRLNKKKANLQKTIYIFQLQNFISSIVLVILSGLIKFYNYMIRNYSFVRWKLSWSEFEMLGVVASRVGDSAID